MVAAPLGTYTGWNPRAHGYGHGVQWRFEGSYIPFPETAVGTCGDRRSTRFDPGTLPNQAGLSGRDRGRRAGTRRAGIDAGWKTWSVARKWRRIGAGRVTM
jgi:hypothetical protein